MPWARAAPWAVAVSRQAWRSEGRAGLTFEQPRRIGDPAPSGGGTNEARAEPPFFELITARVQRFLSDQLLHPVFGFGD